MANLPTKYQWLNTVGLLPRTIQEALKFYGETEIPGARNNPKIMAMVAEINAKYPGRVKGYVNDDIAWCSLFATYVLMKAGKAIVKVNPLWSRNYTTYATESEAPSLGDVLVFSRGSGGHIGFYVGEDSTCFHVLGGNQANSVNITRINKNRLLSCRKPGMTVPPKSRKPYRLAASGAVSTNER